jgi:hypothetical protein
VAILLLILGADLPALLAVGRVALWVAVFAAGASGVDYYRRFNHVLSGRDAPAPPAPPAPRSPVQRDQVSNIHRVH